MMAMPMLSTGILRSVPPSSPPYCLVLNAFGASFYVTKQLARRTSPQVFKTWIWSLMGNNSERVLEVALNTVNSDQDIEINVSINQSKCLASTTTSR